MLEYIIEVNVVMENVHPRPMIEVACTVVDGHNKATAIEILPEDIAHTIKHNSTGRLVARIINPKCHDNICKELKHRALRHLHSEAKTELRMNER